MAIRKILITCPRVRQIQDLCRKKYKKGFSKKGLAKIEFFLLFYVPMNLAKAWNAELRAASFLLLSKILYKECERNLLELKYDNNLSYSKQIFCIWFGVRKNDMEEL